jgi:HAD superfamily hydrolase (TIGR01509 family)
MIRRIDAVVFDMDGTLFDSMDPVTGAFIDTIVEAGGRRYAPEEVVEAFTQGPSERVLEHLLGRPITDAGTPCTTDAWTTARRRWRPYPGVDASLDSLDGAGLRLALFTGADVTSLELLLSRAGLRDRFEVRTGGDEAGRAKPDPAGIRLTCERLGVAPSMSAYVGDSEQDMLAARAAGALAVGAGWGASGATAILPMSSRGPRQI